MPNAIRPIVVKGTPGPDKVALVFRALAADDRPARFEFAISGHVVILEDPESIRALIEEMTEGYQILFPRTEAGS